MSNPQRQKYQKPQRDNIVPMPGQPPIPYSQEAEEALIGAILVNPMTYVVVSAFLVGDDIWTLRLRYIWFAIERIAERGDKIDYLSVVEELRNIGKLADCGGPAYITQLINSTPDSTHAELYGRLVEREATRRKLLTHADDIKALAYNKELSIESVIDGAHIGLMKATKTAYLRHTDSLSNAIGDYFEKIKGRNIAYQKGEPVSLGVPTGLRNLDDKINGLMKGTVTIVGGVAGMGKSSYCLTTALNAAKIGARVALFPLERNREWVVNRLLAMETNIDRNRINSGQMTNDEWRRFLEASARLSDLPITIFERPNKPGWQLTPRMLVTQASVIAYEHGLDLLIVDHMSLMVSGVEEISVGSYQDKAYVSSSIPHVAERLNVPVLIAAQVNVRKVNSRSLKRRRPELGDLEYVGEKDMDTCLFLYRDSMYNPKAEDKTLTEIIVAKNRDGGWLGTVKAQYTGEKYMDVADPDAAPHIRDLSNLEPLPHWTDKY